MLAKLFAQIAKIVDVVLVACIFLSPVYATWNYYSTKTYTVTVTEKAVKNYSGGSVFLVFTKLEDKSTRVFCIRDSLIKLRWDSADMYGDIQAGQSYQFEVFGWRIPFFTMYENITKISPRNNS